MTDSGKAPRSQEHGRISSPEIDLVHVIDASVAQLWETIESLERLQPRNLERFRVSIFGSGRIPASDPLYAEAQSLAEKLAVGHDNHEVGLQRRQLRDTRGRVDIRR